MSLTFEFVNYDEAKSGAALHTIQHIEYNRDPDSIRGVDYYHQEAQKISVICYIDSWLQENLLCGIKSNNDNVIGNTVFWDKVIRVKRDNVIDFIAYIKKDGVHRSGMDNQLEITGMNSIGLLFSISNDYDKEYLVETEFETRDLLWNLLQRLLSEEPEITLPLDISITENYDLISGWYWNDTIDEGTFSEWTIPNGIFPFYVTMNPKRSFQCIYFDTEGILNVVKMKFWQGTIPISDVFEYITVRHFKIRNSIIIYDDHKISHHQHWTFMVPSEQEDYWEQVAADALYHEYYLNLGYPASNITSLETDAGDYNIDGDDLIFTGLANFENVIFKRENDDSNYVTINFKSMLRKFILLNNLCLQSEKNGDIVIINKDGYDDEFGTITVNDIDIQADDSNSILLDPPNFENEFNIFENSEIIGKGLTAYMKLLTDDMDDELDLEIIESSRILSIALRQKIITKNPQGIYKNYQVAEVDPIPDEKLFKVKLWNIVNEA